MYNLHDKTSMITGANSGIGKEAAIPMAGLFKALIAIAVGMLSWYLKSLRIQLDIGIQENISILRRNKDDQ